MLRVEPTQRPRLLEITRNLGDRIAEARTYGWHGEVEGLKVSLDAAERKLVSLDRLRATGRRGAVTELGLPILRADR
jgi:hypothetical protein